MSDHSSPAAVPTFSESKKRLRGDNVERFFDDVKREKIEPVPTKGAKPRPDLWLNSLLPVSFLFLFSHAQEMEEEEGRRQNMVEGGISPGTILTSFFFFFFSSF